MKKYTNIEICITKGALKLICIKRKCESPSLFLINVLKELKLSYFSTPVENLFYETWREFAQQYQENAEIMSKKLIMLHGRLFDNAIRNIAPKTVEQININSYQIMITITDDDYIKDSVIEYLSEKRHKLASKSKICA